MAWKLYGICGLVGRASTCVGVTWVWSLPGAPSWCGHGPSGPKQLGWLINQQGHPSLFVVALPSGSDWVVDVIGRIWYHRSDSDSLVPCFNAKCWFHICHTRGILTKAIQNGLVIKKSKFKTGYRCLSISRSFVDIGNEVNLKYKKSSIFRSAEYHKCY